MKLVTNKFKSGGPREKHVVATWNIGNRLSVCLQAQGNQENPVSKWPVAGPSEYWLLPSSQPVKKQCTHSTTNIHRITKAINTAKQKQLHTRQLKTSNNTHETN